LGQVLRLRGQEDASPHGHFTAALNHLMERLPCRVGILSTSGYYRGANAAFLWLKSVCFQLTDFENTGISRKQSKIM
jgi:hypothetical protein